MSTPAMGHPGLSTVGLGASSTLAASSDFAARALRLGSTRARSAYSSAIPGPTPFAPHEVSAGAVAVKLAHAIIAGRSRANTDELNRRQAEQSFRANETSMRLAEARINALNKPVDSYTPEGGGPTFTGPQAESAWAHEHPTAAPKEATPRAGVTLTKPVGDWKPGDVVDPDELRAYTTLHGQRLAAARAGQRQTSARHYTAAESRRKDLDADIERKATADVANYYRPILNQHLAVLDSPRSTREQRAAASAAIGLPGWAVPHSATDPQLPIKQQARAVAINSWLAQQKERRRQVHAANAEPMRKQIEAVKESEAWSQTPEAPEPMQPAAEPAAQPAGPDGFPW